MNEDFVSSQTISLEARRKLAAQKIEWYADSAAKIEVTPILMPYSTLLTPLRLTMSVHIIHIYGLEDFAQITTDEVGNIIASKLGKALAGELIEPTILNDPIVICTGIASLKTSAIGFAVSRICYDSCKKILSGEDVDINTIFNSESIHLHVQNYMEIHGDY